MNKVSIFTHVFDDSYIGASVSELEKNLIDLNIVIQKRRGNNVSFFSYDNDFFDVNLSGNLKLANALYSESFNRQVSSTLSKTLLHGHQCAAKINNIAMLQSDIESTIQFDSSDKNSYALWGKTFTTSNPNYVTDSVHENSFFENTIKSCLDNRTFWNLKEVLFPNLYFVDEIERMISIVSGKDFNSVMNDLKMLNDYLNDVSVNDFSYKKFKEQTMVDISPEDDQTMKQDKYKNMRMFNIPRIGRTCCDLHMKTVNHRTHIYPETENGKMWIAYIGPHLPTATYKT